MSFYSGLLETVIQVLDHSGGSNGAGSAATISSLFRGNFIADVQLLDTQERCELSNRILQKVSTMKECLEKHALSALSFFVGNNSRELKNSIETYMEIVFSQIPPGSQEPDFSEFFSCYESEMTQKLLSLLPNTDYLFKRIDGILESFPESSLKQLFSLNAALQTDIQNALVNLSSSFSSWLAMDDHRRAADSGELIDAFLFLKKSKRVFKFYKFETNSNVKESFLLLLSATINEILNKEDTGEREFHYLYQLVSLAKEIDSVYFYLHSGSVRERFTSNQISKYSQMVIERCKRRIEESIITKTKLIKIITVFAKIESQTSVHFSNTEKKIIEFINVSGEAVKIPRGVVNRETLGRIAELVDFEVNTDNGLIRIKHSDLIVQEEQPEDIVDVLMEEILSKIPVATWKFKERPKRLGNKQYQVLGKTVNLLSRAMKLYVSLSGQPEQEAVVYLAKEFGVSPHSLRSTNASPTMGALIPSALLNDACFLYRIIRGGLKARDEYWRALWRQFAEKLPEKSAKKQQSIEPLQKFIKMNLQYLEKKEWAKKYLSAGEEESSGSEIESFQSNNEETNNAFFKTRKCIAFQAGKCARGDRCFYAHSDSELRQGPTFVPPPAQTTNHLNRSMLPPPTQQEEKENEVALVLPEFRREPSPKKQRKEPPKKKIVIDDDDI
jgi:Zinc finger C-x8-C-x5-C-x3-H type (and similar)